MANSRAIPGAVLLNVHTPEKCREGHISGSKKVPLETIDKVAAIAENKDMALFVYCCSGARSSQATGTLQRMRYTSVNDIGDIAACTRKWRYK